MVAEMAGDAATANTNTTNSNKNNNLETKKSESEFTVQKLVDLFTKLNPLAKEFFPCYYPQNTDNQFSVNTNFADYIKQPANDNFNNNRRVVINMITLIGWAPPPQGWIKVNTDGSLKQASGMASAGGIIRDGDGKWQGGFSHLLGHCSVTMAELWGAVDGLQLAWELGHRKVILEMDSKIIIDHVQGKHTDRSNLSLENLMDYLLLMTKWEWQVHFQHTLREGNRCADCLASLAYKGDLGLTIHHNPPNDVKEHLYSDFIGVAWPRGH